ncbi:SRPBCC family protein [Kitasatospora sp. NPDC059811]|uniref:SRPBCC family protein n=1 Tax=Streptomycetaceae TaxID=2062 RepID=UPI000D1A5B1B|nr:SRPBCC family protein [Streptomyces sp. MJM8645]
MEHEVVVPMPAELVRQALQDPALLARSVPGLSTEPAAVGTGPAEEIGGRLKLRIGGSTITYKGVLSLIEGREGVLTVFAEGQEARGSGEATATVRVSVADGAEDGTAVVRFTGDLSATGRLTEFDEETLDAAGRRLLDRFATALASPDAGPEPESENDGEGDPETGSETGSEAEAGTDASVVFIEEHQDQPGDDLDDDLSDLIAFSDADAERFGLPTGGGDEDGPEEGVAEELPAEPLFEYEEEPAGGGPVRRSIVGRSAEEVDHAPPRGRYAPALPARSARARAASRWGGEAGGIVVPGSGGRSAVPWVIGGGVALLGGAVVLVRALRRR